MNHLAISLSAAARLVVRQDGYKPGSINIAAWSRTYRCSESEVEEALKLAENGRRKLPDELAVTAPPEITYDGDGK